MRILFCTILLAILLPRWSRAEELISGVLVFDPPAFLSGSTNFESGTRKVWRYAATDNDPRTSQRLLVVSIREVGDMTLRAEMQAAVNSIRNATNIAPVTDAEVGGQAALLASFQVLRPYWQKPEGVLFPSEVYWVKVQTNQVVEIRLIADSMEHLQTLKPCLSQFKITKKDGVAAAESTASSP